MPFTATASAFVSFVKPMLELAAPIAEGTNFSVTVADAPGLIVAGSVRPETGNTSLVPEMAVMTTGIPPELLSVVVEVAELPTFTLPNWNEPGDAPSTPGFAAVPVMLSDAVPPFASLVKLTEPLALPVAFGENATFRLFELPAAIVTGNVQPLIAKAVLETLADEMVRVMLPELETVTAFVDVLPTATVPKETAVGLASSFAIPPLPFKPIFLPLPLDLSVVTVTVPLLVPDTVGVNSAVAE